MQYVTSDEQTLFEMSLDLEPRDHHRKKSSVNLSAADLPSAAAGDAKLPMTAAASAPVGGYAKHA